MIMFQVFKFLISESVAAGVVVENIIFVEA